MKKKLIQTVILVVLTGALGARVEAKSAADTSKTPVMLELFTSEGCSSCPPADRLLEALDEKQPFSGVDLIVLSEHVDYWNHDGWADPYSSPMFTSRQQDYAEHLKSGEVYTPQAVIDGERQTVGANVAGIQKAVEAAVHEQKVALTIANAVRDGNRIKFHLTSADLPAAEKQATVYVAVAENKVQSKVSGGENGGRSLSHVAVVRKLASVGKVKGGSSFSKDITIQVPSGAGTSGLRLVVFLQADSSHKIVGATQEKMSCCAVSS